MERVAVLRCVACRGDARFTDVQKNRKYDLPQLQEHVAKTHCGLDRFKCLGCSKMFATDFMAVCHMASNKGKECSESLKGSGYDRRFLQVHTALVDIDPQTLAKCYEILNDSMREMACNVINETLHSSELEEKVVIKTLVQSDAPIRGDVSPPPPPPKFLKGTTISWPLFPKRRAAYSHTEVEWANDGNESNTLRHSDSQCSLISDEVFNDEQRNSHDELSKKGDSIVDPLSKSPNIVTSDEVVTSLEASSPFSENFVESEGEEVEEMLRKRDQSDPLLATADSPPFIMARNPSTISELGALWRSDNDKDSEFDFSTLHAVPSKSCFPTPPSDTSTRKFSCVWKVPPLDNDPKLHSQDDRKHIKFRSPVRSPGDLQSRRPRSLQLPHSLAQPLTIQIPKQETTFNNFPGYVNEKRRFWNTTDLSLMVAPSNKTTHSIGISPSHSRHVISHPRQLIRSYFPNRSMHDTPNPVYVQRKPIIKMVPQQKKYHLQPTFISTVPFAPRTTVTIPTQKMQYSNPQQNNRSQLPPTVYELRSNVHLHPFHGDDYNRNFI